MMQFCEMNMFLLFFINYLSQKLRQRFKKMLMDMWVGSPIDWDIHILALLFGYGHAIKKEEAFYRIIRYMLFEFMYNIIVTNT